MTDKDFIKGGYYIKARSIKDSAIMHSPPHVREVWDWLLMNANHAEGKSSGRVILRGQLFTSLDEIREGLRWYVGYRKECYTKDHMKKAMVALKSASMITTSKSTRGLLITVCNYDAFQDPTSYESTSESTAESTNEAPSKHQTSTTINKNSKKKKKKKEEEAGVTDLPLWLPLDDWADFLHMRRVDIKKPASSKAQELLIGTLQKMIDSGQDPGAVLRQSTMNSWQGLFEVKGNFKNDNGFTGNKSKSRAHDNFAAGAFEFATEQ